MLIALLEDDEPIARIVEGWLAAAGYRSVRYASASAFRGGVRGQQPELVIVDRILPDGDGIEITKWFRAEASPLVPVLFASVLGDEESIVAALDAGADDYVVKPLRREEVLARVRALARRAGAVRDGPIRCGAVALDIANRTASLHGAPVKLTEMEFEVAAHLMRNRGRLVTRAELLATVWGTAMALQTRSVDTHVSRVRHKLGLQRENGFTLEAVYNHGYRLQHESDAR